MTRLFIIIILMTLVSCARYDEGIATYDVEVQLSEPEADVEVSMRDGRSTLFTCMTDSAGTAHFTLPTGIYQASATKVSDDGYVRKVFNGNISDLVVEGMMTRTMNITTSVITLNNPIIIKEVYCGGCQKDDGSGTFARDKCIILYNNSSEPMSLDSVAIGMVEPYNAEASAHNFLVSGKLEYEDESWIPAINGIWYFQDGQTIAPYSELVVNVYGAIDNTTTYSGSINYANSDYYCMYDPSYTDSKGNSYNNTIYYPTPSPLIPTSHYLRTVKYGQANAWPMSQFSPALLLFKPHGVTPKEYAEKTENIIYPSSKNGNVVYACLRVERSWVLDAVEIYNQNKLSDSRKRITSDLDNGYVTTISGYGHAVVRKVERTIDGHPVYQDTNNSTNDFYEAEKCSLK